MKYFTSQIIKFSEDQRNQPSVSKMHVSRNKDEKCGNIRRFIYSNQSVDVHLSKNIIHKYKRYVNVIPEMDSDITENQKYYEAGLAFCEFDCFQCKLFITQQIYSSLDEIALKIVPCMIYGSELASNEAKQFLNDISHTAVDFAPDIPSFDIPLNDKLTFTKFNSTKYYPYYEFENHNCNAFDASKVDVTTQRASLLFLNIPYEIYSECMNNMHHLNYNLNFSQFVCLRKSIGNFKSLYEDIERNGLKTPITFELRENNIAPIENSSRILIAILLKIPFITACVFKTGVKYPYNNMYFKSKNTTEKLNKLLYPYFILSD